MLKLVPTVLAAALSAAAVVQPALAATPAQFGAMVDRWENRVDAGLDVLDRLQAADAAPSAATQSRIIGVLVAVVEASSAFQAADEPPDGALPFCYQKIIWTFKGTDEELQAVVADQQVTVPEARALLLHLETALDDVARARQAGSAC